MLRIDSVTRRFSEGGSTLTVLEDLSFDIAPGSKVALMGASGAGKTTLLQIIGGLDHPTSGSVSIDGTYMNKLREKPLANFRNKNLGFIFQFHHLMSDFTALENVFMPGLIAGMKRPACHVKARNLLKEVGVNHRAKHHPGELSGGERQRVALARALFNDPALILADEPTGNLDRENREHFLDLVDKLNREKNQTFLIATHDDDVAAAMDYRLVLRDKKVYKE